MSNPPTRGSGQGGNKTIGKHQVPILNVEEMMEQKENNSNNGDGNVSERPQLIHKQLARTTAAAAGLAHSRSFPASLSNSPNGTPNSQRRQLPPSGIKLPVPPPSLLNGLPNVHKSVSSASLNLHAVTASAGKSDRLRETVTVPNAGEMLAAARAELIEGRINGDGGKSIGPGIGRPSKPLARLPPLQLPKGPKMDEDGSKRVEQAKVNDDEGGEKKAEDTGPIATMCTESMPQMKAMDLSKIPPPTILPSSDPSNGQMEQSMANSQPQSVATTPLPPQSARPSPLPPDRAPPINFIPNEVPIHQHNPRRRPSSAGQIPSALTTHKPLPAISEPVAIKKGRRPFSTVKKWHKSRSRGWRLALKCGIIFMFLAIPVIIFVLMMFASDGFAPAKGNSTTIPDSSSSTQMPQLMATTTPSNDVGSPTAVNIVGGAIFAPISMQNDTAIGNG